MTTPCFSLQRKPRLTLPAGDVVVTAPRIETFLPLGHPYVRLKKLRSSETTPLYQDGSVDYNDLSANTGFTRWYIENANPISDFTTAAGRFQIQDGKLTNPFVDNDYGLIGDGLWRASIKDSLTAVLIASRSNASFSGRRRLFRFNGHFSVEVTRTGFFVVRYESSAGAQQLSSSDFSSQLQDLVAITLKIRPDRIQLYIGTTLAIDAPIASGFLEGNKFAPVISAIAFHPIFFTRWVGDNQPSIAEINSLIPLLK